MRQWHQGKEGFMKVTRIQDKYNPDKVWMIKRYLCGTFYVNQEINRDRKGTGTYQQGLRHKDAEKAEEVPEAHGCRGDVL